MFYIFVSDAVSRSFFSVMDYSKQALHFELGKVGEGQAAGKNRRGGNFTITSS